MPYATAAKNAMLNHLGTLATHVSLHSADPGAGGANELSGGGYARQAITWNSASGGSLDSSNQPVFTVPAASTVAFVGFWSAATNGTFYGSASVPSETFTNAGTYTLTDADLDLNAA